MFTKLISQVNASSIDSDKLEEQGRKIQPFHVPQIYFAYAGHVCTKRSLSSLIHYSLPVCSI